ncbi:hypothetical protein HWV62_24622 [Athelia sp. TMB]|nr:hypothetical protein HWV62_24622 [Athelia sp. TMB]
MAISWPTPDQALAALLPLALLLVAWRLFFTPSISSSPKTPPSSSPSSDSTSAFSTTLGSPNASASSLPLLPPIPASHPLSLATALNGYSSYGRIATAELARMRATLAALSRASRRLALGAGYGKRLDALADATAVNEKVVFKIVRLARDVMREDAKRRERGGGLEEGGGWESLVMALKGNVAMGGEAGPGSIERVREALKHLVRDWSTEGASERETFHTPIMEALQLLFPQSKPCSSSSDSDFSSASTTTDSDSETERPIILIPGAALSRLAHTLSQSPYNMRTHACELSYYPILALQMLLDLNLTPKEECHELRPWAHWFSHQRGEDFSLDGQLLAGKGALRSVRVPDVVPRLTPRFQILSGDFLHVPAPGTGYDALASLFFIDTSIDVTRTIAHIFTLLKPGGWWVNCGPLLWTGGGLAVELSLAEVLSVVRAVGFEIWGEGNSSDRKNDEEERRKVLGRRVIRGEYTADRQAMMSWVYEAEFWVARKPVSASA